MTRWWNALRARMRLAFDGRGSEQRFDDEIEFHIQCEAERLVREQGVEPLEARRRAVAVFGGVQQHKEALRDGRGLSWLNGMSLDLRLGLRMLGKYPGLAVIAVLGMSVAIAIGSVVFSVLYAAIDSTLPFDDGDRIVSIQELRDGSDNDGRRLHLHDLATWRAGLRAVDELGAYRTIDRNLITVDGRPEPVRIAEMGASVFRLTRVAPLLGRYVLDEDERAGAPPVVVIGYKLWQSRFNGRADVIGQPLQLGATRHTIVGVMPDGYAFPINNRLWTPLKLDPLTYERGNAPGVYAVGRLAPGATIADASLQLETIARQLAADHPATHEKVRARVLPYTLAFIDSPEILWAFHLFQVFISLLLVVIGTNVAILVYARTATRTGEIAVRTALGASRRRIVAQLFGEALVLTAISATVGVGLAYLTLRQASKVIALNAGEQLPFWMTFGISRGVIAYAAVLAIVAAVIVGVLPALKATRRRVAASLQDLSPGGGAGMRLGKLWTVLIVAQVASAVAILPVTIDGLSRWVQVTLEKKPYPTEQWLTTSLRLDREGAGTEDDASLDDAHAARYARLEAEVLRRLDADAAIENVVLASDAPGDEPNVRFETEGAAASLKDGTTATAAGVTVGVSQVERDYFAAFDVPVLLGRAFVPGDMSATATSVIVNRSFVEGVLGGGEALGRRVRPVPGRGPAAPDATPQGPWYEIVGVVPDFPHSGSTRLLQPRLYRPLPPGGVPGTTIAVQVRGGDPMSYADRLRQMSVDVDPMLRLGAIRVLDGVGGNLERRMDRFIFVGVVITTLSIVMLSAAGVYALMSFTITRRRREIGIRVALGAGARRVLWSILLRAAGQIGLGIAIGVLLAGTMQVAASRDGLTLRVVVVLAAVAALMVGVGLLATLGPARRALGIEPTEALRSE